MAGLHFESSVDRGFEQGIDRMMRKVDELNAKTTKKVDETSASFNRLQTAAMATFSTVAMGAFVGKVIEVRSEIQSLEIAFTSMLQSKQASQKLMADIIQTAATTPYSVIEIANNAKKLMAFGESAETVISVTRRLGDVASATGSDIGGIALAYGQVMAKGRLQTQELNQLQERGIPILDELAKMHGKNKVQIVADIEAQKIGFNDLKQVIFNLTAEGGRFYNLMAENAKTLRGQVSNLGDQFDKMLNDTGEANNGVLSGGIAGLSLLIENWENIADAIGTVVIAYGAYKAAVMSVAAIDMVKRTAEAVQLTMLFTKELGFATAAQQAFNVAGMANPYALLIAGIAGVVAGLALFVDWTDDSEQALVKLQTTISETTNKQTAELINLRDSVNKVNASDADRIKVVNKINEAYAAELGHTVSLSDGNLVLVESIDKIIAKKKLQIDLAEREKAIIEKTARLSDIKDIATGKQQDKAGFLGFFESGKTINGTFVRQSIIDEYDQLQKDIAKLREGYNDSQNQLLAGESKGTDAVKARRIADIRNDIKAQTDAREQARTTDIEGIKKYNAEIKRLQLELDTLLGGGKEAKVDRSASIALLETEHTKRVTAINKQYAYDKTQAVEHQRSMLAEEADYLAKKSKLAGTDLERATIAQQQVANQQAQQRLAEKKTLKELLDEYKSYADKKAELEKKYADEYERLAKAGKQTEAELATEAGRKALDQLEASFLASSEKYQTFLSSDLPRLVSEGGKSLDQAMRDVESKLSTEKSAENIAILRAELVKLNEAAKNMKGVSLIDPKSSATAAENLQAMQDSLQVIASVVGDDGLFGRAVGNLMSLAGAAASASEAMGKLDENSTKAQKIAAYGVVAGIVVKSMGMIEDEITKYEKSVDSARSREIRLNAAVNLQLIEKNALYAEGNEFFASDKYGTVLANLEAYNQALENEKKLIADVNSENRRLNTDRSLKGDITGQSRANASALGSLFKEGVTPDNFAQAKTTYRAIATGGLSVFSRRKNAKNDAAVQATIDAQTNDTARALASIEVTTKERNKLGKFVGLEDKTASLLSLYPQLVDAQGELNKAVLEQAIADGKVSEADTARMQALLDNLNTAEAAYVAFGDYIAGIFGGVADSVAQSMFDAYISGDDAMTGLEKSMSDMIESFSRDIIEFAFLQPLLDEVNATVKDLGVKRASGAITNDQLQTGVIQSLGSFYKGVNAITPEIMQAYASLDQLAASQGFDSAFNGDGGASSGTLSAGARVAQQITEQTGTELVGRVNAIMLGVEKMSIASDRAYELSVKKLAILSRISDNTDYLPEIALNTRKTADRLGV